MSQLVAESHAMREVLAQVHRSARTPGGVLVTGEPGTGRRFVSSLLHEVSGVPGDFVAVECDVIQPAELDETLFGKAGARGPSEGQARNDATTSSRFERVFPGSALHRTMNGTLCLSRLEELPERLQAKLARVLRDGEFIVAGEGGGQPQEHRIRPLALADAGFDQHVRDGKIRHDLHKRFSVHTIQVPPLRERREDIPRLAQAFAAEATAYSDFPVKTLAAPAEQLLTALPWWGNARELRGVIGAVVQQSAGSRIELDALLSHLTLNASAGSGPGTSAGETLRAARTRFEREYIAAVLAQHRGRIPEAARSLGIQRTNLYRKLRSLNL